MGTGARVEGRPLIDVGELRVGDDFPLWSHDAIIHVGGAGRLVIGDRVFINSGAVILAHNHIVHGDDVAVGFGATIVDSHMHGVAAAPVRYDTTVIGSGTWIGMRAIVLANVRVGRRCIVGAGSVVTKDVPDDTLVVGSPARVIRTLQYPEGVRAAWNNRWEPEYWSDGGRAPAPADI